jgi:hypothetical protein
MAALTHDSRTPLANGATRAERPAGVPAARRVTLAAACYAGLAVIVAITLLLTRMGATPVAAVVFVLGSFGVVGLLHPKMAQRIAQRR